MAFFVELLLRWLQECVKVQSHIHPLKAIPVRPAAQQQKHLRFVRRGFTGGLGLSWLACTCRTLWRGAYLLLHKVWLGVSLSFFC